MSTNAEGLLERAERAVDELADPGVGVDADRMLEGVWVTVSTLTQRAKALEARLKEIARELIEKNGDRPVAVGDQVLCSGRASQRKCTDVSAVLIQLIEHTEGDVEQLALFLKAQPFKEALVVSTVGDEHFKQIDRGAVLKVVPSGVFYKKGKK